MERLSPLQFRLLAMAIIVSTLLVHVPTLVLLVAGRDSWMCMLPGLLLIIPYGYMVIALMNDYPGDNLLQVSEKVFGKWIGKGIGVLFALVFTYLGGLVLSQPGIILANSSMPLTPAWIFHLTIALLVLMLGWAGIEVLGRFTEVVLPFTFLMLITVLTFTIPHFEKGELFPLLNNGLKPVLQGTVQVLPQSLEYIGVLAMLLPFLPNDKKSQKNLFKSLCTTAVVVGLAVTIFMSVLIMVFSYEVAVRFTFPLVVLSKMVSLKHTLAGGESIMEMVGIGAFIIKSASLFFASFWAFTYLFNLKSNLWKIALVIIYISVAIVTTRGIDFFLEAKTLDNFIILPFIGMWIPALWVMNLWKRRKKA